MGEKEGITMTNMNNSIKTAISQAVANCTNHISLEDMIKLESFETIVETRNISELLAQKKKEVADLEATIAEAEEAKAKAEAKEKAEAEKQEKFMSSLTDNERVSLSYLEGIGTLATDENKKLINMLLDIFANCTANMELALTTRLAAYVTVLIINDQKDTINLLESITLKIDNIQCNKKEGSVNIRLSRFERILLAVQDLY